MCKCKECFAAKRRDAIEESYAEFVSMVHAGQAVGDVLDFNPEGAEKIAYLVLKGEFNEAKALIEQMLDGAADRYAHSMNEPQEKAA